MTNPEVQHGKQPHVNPEVAVNGPLGATTVKVGGEQVPVSPEPTEGTDSLPEAPAEPDVVEPEAAPEQDAADSDDDDTADADA